MRSVYAFFKNAQKEEIIEFLDLNCESCCEDIQWLICKKDSPVLYISFDKDEMLINDLDEEGLDEINDKLHTFPTNILIIDISGRHPGADEVFDFLKLLFNSFEILVMDDFTEYLWTRDEIFNEVKIKNHKFFDYLGWYHERHK